MDVLQYALGGVGLAVLGPRVYTPERKAGYLHIKITARVLIGWLAKTVFASHLFFTACLTVNYEVWESLFAFTTIEIAREIESIPRILQRQNTKALLQSGYQIAHICHWRNATFARNGERLSLVKRITEQTEGWQKLA